MAVAAEPNLADIDLTDLDRWAQGVPHDWFALLRRDAPVFCQDEGRGRGFWSLTRYDDVLAASKDWQTFSAEVGWHPTGSVYNVDNTMADTKRAHQKRHA